ncbi:hypothetical protein FISHEDRAFT_5967, partial [Fistulina hepatica ATCC 64428]
SSSDRRAKKSALILRSAMLAPVTAPTISKHHTQLGNVKADLLHQKSANKIISHLRTLPTSDNATSARDPIVNTPIHAVCLGDTDKRVQQKHFANLAVHQGDDCIDKMKRMIDNISTVDLVQTASLGVGQPGDGVGILAGAVPTAETIIKGIQRITPELMQLGYVTGRAITPDHSGVHPPTDRISVFTYWWGLEIALPPPTLAYLESADSISTALINFLSALSLVSGGVREILPFVRYISQFVDYEFQSIKKEDHGRGVVCAATWIMPAALVARQWDFPP